jgi:hypothetical protein
LFESDAFCSLALGEEFKILPVILLFKWHENAVTALRNFDNCPDATEGDKFPGKRGAIAHYPNIGATHLSAKRK